MSAASPSPSPPTAVCYSRDPRSGGGTGHAGEGVYTGAKTGRPLTKPCLVQERAVVRGRWLLSHRRLSGSGKRTEECGRAREPAEFRWASRWILREIRGFSTGVGAAVAGFLSEFRG